MLPIAPLLAFVDVVHQLELARLFQEDRLGLDVGEDVALAAVDFLEQVDVGVHLGLLERLVGGHLSGPSPATCWQRSCCR